jgi:hypothetical protein
VRRRPCSVYRALNARTIPDLYPVRHIHDYSQQLSGCRFFSKIELMRAYNQIAVHPSDIQKTAITTPFGLFQLLFMPFGLRNAAQTFQRFMDDMLRRLDFCFACLDNILVFFRSLEDHERHLRSLFDRLQTYGILINPVKYIIRASEVNFLGYKVSAEVSRPLEERVSLLQDCSPPKTASQLRRFMGMLNFYRTFLPHSATIQAPLHNALSSPSIKGSHSITWTPDLHTVQGEFATRHSTGTPRPIRATCSRHGRLNFLHWCRAAGTCRQRLATLVFSKKLNPAQQKCSAYDRELLAIYEAVKHFRHMPEARHFTNFKHHESITYAFQQKRDKCSPRQFNHLDFIAQFTTDIRHIYG